MWFLLLQIFFLLVLAAVFGAVLAWWWMKRRYEDVTDSHEAMLSRMSRLDALANMPTREELKAGLATLGASIAAIKPTDLSSLHDRLARLERIVADLRTANILPMQEKLTPVADRLAQIEESVRTLKIPEVDLGPVHSGIASLDLAIGGKLGPVEGRIARLEGKLDETADLLDSARKIEADGTSLRLGAIERAIAAIPLPQAIDLQPLHSSLVALERAIAALDKPPLDLGPIHNRFFAIQTALASVQEQQRSRTHLEPIEKRLAALQEALQSIPEPDLAPVMGVVNSIDRRLDIEATENRLTAIEYGLAAVHHMLRSRMDGAGASRQEPVSSLHVSAVPDEPAMPAPSRPPRELDPINSFRRPDDQANLLLEAAFGQPDDLEQISGVGPMLEALLNEIGVFYYWQVAEWTPEDVAWVEGKLMHFRGRILRDDWVGRARILAAGPMAARRPLTYGGKDAAE
jgi:predicted flap endonuclease-1-like 5' DNA nuclease